MRRGGIARVNLEAGVSHHVHARNVGHKIELRNVDALGIDEHAERTGKILPARFLWINRIRRAEECQPVRRHVVEHAGEWRHDEKIGIEEQCESRLDMRQRGIQPERVMVAGDLNVLIPGGDGLRRLRRE